jgi:peptidyl-tRNA hydrolase
VQVYQIVDNGLTEFKGMKTLTCAAFGPDYAEVLDEITGHLKLI